MRVTIVADGRPVPQGSMVASYNRKQGVSHVHHVQGSALALWRAIIREAAAAQMVGKPSALPVAITVTFGMPRPKAHLELRGGRYVVRMLHYYDRPARQPDLDKLVRAVLDALTGVCYTDDSQVVELNASKVYGDETRIEITDDIATPQQTLAFGMEQG